MNKTLNRFGPLLLLIIGLLTLLPGTNSLPLIDRDEPRFAQATVEMMERGDWVIPWFNGEYRFDKPPMTYWLMRGGYALFGINEFGSRFHSVVCTIALALVIFYAGKRWFSPKAGFLAGFFCLTSLQMLIHGRSDVADMPMVLAVTLSCIALYELLSQEHGPTPWRWFWTLHLSLAFGFLAKGPIAWAVPFLALVLLRFALWRKPLPWKRIKLLSGLPIILLPVAAWGIPALIQTGGEFWNVGMGEHVVERGYTIFNARKYIPGYYIPLAIVSLFPWIALIGLVWRFFRGEYSLLTRWLAAWLLAPYIIFSLYLTQLPHYVMPGFAAFFLLLAAAIDREVEMPLWGKRFKRFLLWVGLIAVVGAALAARFALPAGGLRLCLTGLSMTVLGLITLLCCCGTFRLRTLLALLAIAAGLWAAGRGLHSQVPGPQLREIFAELPRDIQCGFSGYTEPNVIFYSNRRWQYTRDLQEFLNGDGPRALLVQETQMKLEDIVKREPLEDRRPELDALDVAGYKIWNFKGFNPARTAFMTLRLYYRSE